jgi:hypothetical protein
MKKVAITGANPQDRTMLSNALSYMIGYDIVRQTAYQSQAIKYGLNTEIKDSNWQELFVYVLSSFSERIEVEQQYEKFISNGGVFNELASMKAIYKYNSKNKRENKEYALMLSGLEKIITEYAIKEYDCIIHISKNIDDDDLVSYIINENLIDLSKDCKMKYQITKDNVISNMLEKIATEMNFHTIVSPETAIAKAQKDMLLVQTSIFIKQEFSDC